MAVIVILLSFILGIIFLVGLFSPKKVLRKAEKPGRGKVFLFFGLPSIILFIVWGGLYESSWDAALKDPASATEVSLKYKDLATLPDELEQMTNVVSLDLALNKLLSLPTYIKNFDKLESLDLSKNPIEVLPIWLADMESLNSLKLDGTQITTIPPEFEGLTISYKDTPLWLTENPEAAESKVVNDESRTEEDDEHDESLSEYALRQFLGKDYGFKRKFKKGEIFYNDPVTKEQVDLIGEFMVEIGIFDDEDEASMLLDYTDEVYELKVVVVSEEALSDLVMESFIAIENAIQLDYFPNDEFHLVLTDGEFDPIKTIK